MEVIETQTDFESAIRSERAILFVSFGWSGQAKLSEQVVAEWERTWNIWHPKLRVSIYKLEPDAHPYTWEWLGGTAERGGYGSLSWVKNGVIVDSEPYVVGAGLRDIARRTEEVFGAG